MNALSPSDVTLHPFDAATAVAPRPGGGWTGATSDAYWAFVGPFGGATAATLLRAVLGEAEAVGDPVALTVNFCAPVARGAFDLSTRLIKANRSTQHWSVELSQGGGAPAAFATAVLAVRRPTWSHQPARMPAPPPREGLAAHVSSVADWTGQYEFRFARGAPQYDGASGQPGEVRSELWLADAPTRPLDALSLTALSDAFFGRIFHARRQVVPFGTVSMTTHFHVDAEDLAAEDATEVFGTADARVFHKSFGDQTAELWSPSGRLLATTQQVFYFKA